MLTFRNLGYVANGCDRQQLDLYLPDDRSRGRPLVIWIHGGAWWAGSKDECPAQVLVPRGYAVASVGYRLSQQAPFPAQLEDCKAAIRWLGAHGAEYGIDPQRIGVWGESAGGHLAALLGTTERIRGFDVGEHLDQASRVQCVVDFFGPTDFLHWGGPEHPPMESPESGVYRLLGGPVSQHRDRARLASPLYHVDSRSAPFLILHGEQDEIVPLPQSQGLHAALTKAGVESTLSIVEAAGHGGPCFTTPANLKRIADFLDRHLGRAAGGAAQRVAPNLAGLTSATSNPYCLSRRRISLFTPTATGWRRKDERPMDRPNIIYLHSHDTGRYIQPYGYAVETPNLQRFAEQGVLFRNAFCAAPTCSPSRAALLTGQYPHQNGMTALAHHGGRLKDPSRHLAHYLKRQGYATALSGTQHVTDGSVEAVQAVGYERFLTREVWPSWARDFESWNQWHAQAAIDYLLKADKDRPFFLDCGFDLTHRMGKGEQWHTTRNAPEGDARYVRPPAPLPDMPETRRDFADFRVAVRLLDECHGRVLAALEQAGLAENTLVVITTDHGLAYPLMKCNLTAHGTGVLLMMRGPKYGGRYVARRMPGDVAPGVPGDGGAEPEPSGMSGGKVIDALVSHVDVFPTLCEAAGLPRPAGLVGESLMPLVDGRATSVRDAVFAEVNWHAAPEPMRSVRTARYNYIRRFAPHTGPVLPNCDDSLSKTVLRRAGWDSRSQVAEELYDLVFDPNEACNRLALHSPGEGGTVERAYAAPLAEMRVRLKEWMEKTDDPLLTGRLEPWPGARITRVTDASPQGEWGPAEAIVTGEL